MPVRLGIDVKATFFDRHQCLNVIAEIPGGDPKFGGEVVMLGAHLDSWHTADGATDNADGAATVIEAIRILKALGARRAHPAPGAVGRGGEGLSGRGPGHTALTGEEKQGERDQLSVYFNRPWDRPISASTWNDDAFRPIVDAWLKPLKNSVRGRM